MRQTSMGLRSALAAIMLLVAACGDDATPTSPLSSATTTAVEGGGATVAPIVGGVRWELPAIACADAGDDPGSLAAAATAAEMVIIDLVSDRVLGWPTTTRARPGEEAEFFVAINRAGPIALSLGRLAGTTDAILTSWAEFEARYATATDSPGPVTIIADRVGGWQTTATAIVAALPAACG